MKLRQIVVLIAALCLSLTALGQAQTVYVTDKVLLGVYREKAQDSELLKMLPTGSPLEILERDGNVAKVRSPDGIEGWVDAAYLINDKPSQLVALELADKNKQATEELEAVRAQLDELKKSLEASEAKQPDGAALKALRAENAKLTEQIAAAGKTAASDAAERDELNKEIAALKARTETASKNGDEGAKALGAAEQKIAELEQQLVAQRDEASERITTLEQKLGEQGDASTQAESQLQALRAEHTALQARLQDAVTLLTGEEAGAARPGPAAALETTAGSAFNLPALGEKWYLIGAAALFLFGLLLGALVMDRRYVRRHGGFRI